MAFDHFEELTAHVVTLTSANTDYAAGLTEKGNGIATDAGFWIYKIMHIGDVVIDSVEIFSNCKLENQLLSVGKTVTSVSGALNTVTNFFWRNFST